MSVFYNQEFGNCKTALELLTKFPNTAGKDGYYFLYPSGRSNPGQLVYCDMTTDGGGWMLVARSHPSVVNLGSTNWGWQGGQVGSVKDFTQAYQAGWFTNWHNNASRFSSFIFGNRANINNNIWGTHIYKNSGLNYLNFIGSDTQQAGTRSVLKFDTSVYHGTLYPGMQNAIGFPVTATAANTYYLRDCCGWSDYGGKPTFFATAYCSSDSVLNYSGPWCGGSSQDANGNFLSGTYLTAGNTRYGGTNQYMIMVK
jgi:hypothetical protein